MIVPNTCDMVTVATDPDDVVDAVAELVDAGAVAVERHGLVVAGWTAARFATVTRWASRSIVMATVAAAVLPMGMGAAERLAFAALFERAQKGGGVPCRA